MKAARAPRPPHALASSRPGRASFWRAARLARPRAPQNGAAVITALFVVALSALLVSGLLWRQQVLTRRVENQRMSAQASWVARGAGDWARLVLRAAADSAPVTYLGGAWGVPIAETRLSDFLGRMGAAAGGQGSQTWLAGSIVDEQAKFNLRDLVESPAPGVLRVDGASLASFQKLLSVLGLDTGIAERTARRLRESLLGSSLRSARGSGLMQNATGEVPLMPGAARAEVADAPPAQGLAAAESQARPLPMTRLDALLDVPGVDADVLERLAPFATILPVPTPVNLNTAPAEVIAATIPGLALSGAQSFVSARDTAFVLNLADAELRLKRFSPLMPALEAERFDVTSRFFVVNESIRHEHARLRRRMLIFRDPQNHQTRVVQVDDAK